MLLGLKPEPLLEMSAWTSRLFYRANPVWGWGRKQYSMELSSRNRGCPRFEEQKGVREGLIAFDGQWAKGQKPEEPTSIHLTFR